MTEGAVGAGMRSGATSREEHLPASARWIEIHFGSKARRRAACRCRHPTASTSRPAFRRENYMFPSRFAFAMANSVSLMSPSR